MDTAQFERIKRYVGFDDDSSRMLHEFYHIAAPHFQRIADDFYAAITAHPTASQVVTGGQEQVDRLKQTLTGWMQSVLRGPHDIAYLETHSRIGRMHVRIALPQEYMFTAMNRIRSRFVEIAHQQHSGEEARLLRVVSAINQILDLELSIMLDTYREDLLEKMRSVERQEVAEAVPTYVLALDRTERIALWNSALEEATGFSRSEMVGQPGTHLIGSGDRKLAVKGGGHRMVRWQSSPPMNESGLTFAMGVDVTDELAMQRRTLRAERLAAVGTLAAGLAHEVRNPLNSAVLQLQVLRRRIERGQINSESVLPVCDLVGDEIRRLDRLVTDFLAFAQRRPLELRPTGLNQLVSAVVDLVRPEAQAADIEVITDLHPDVGTVEVEAERMRQVLLNLTRNALEAIRRDGTLTIRSCPADLEGNVRVEVQDTGPGFPEDAPIFDAFYTTKEAGTGLGLAIVHRIVTDHGGSIAVQTRPGETMFSIRLPQQSAVSES